MASTNGRGYDLIEDYNAGENPDVLGSSPDWCVIIMRLMFPLTYSRSAGESFSKDYDDAVKLRGDSLVFRSSCTYLSTMNSKSTHLMTLDATIMPGFDLIAQVMPGDRVFAFMSHDSKTIDDVIDRVKRGEPVNRFHDGLKFVGEVLTVSESLNSSREGVKATRYKLNAQGFSEFKAIAYYDPHLAEREPAIGRAFARLNSDLNQLIESGKNGISSHLGLQWLMDLLLGRGIPESLGLESTNPALRWTAGLDSPYGYVVPKEVGALLGKTSVSKSSGKLTASDITEFVYGMQTYGELKQEDFFYHSADDHDASIGVTFAPDGQGSYGDTNRRYTGKPMLGDFLPMPPDFSGRSIWTILHQFLAPTSEMYTCLRVNPQGKVVPTVVARQLPFTTELYNGKVAVTRFLSLPRWRVDPRLVTGATLVRSGTQRVNWVSVQGDTGAATASLASGQLVRAPPRRDDLDIARSGLSMYRVVVNNNPVDNYDGKPANDWQDVMSDILIGGHLLLTGTVELYGVQAPICIGDNIEFRGIVLHIEAISHTCMMEGSEKTFKTSLQLTHGLSANPDVSTTTGIYVGLDGQELSSKGLDALRPGLSVDGQPYEDNRTVPFGKQSVADEREDAERTNAEKARKARALLDAQSFI